MSNKVIYSPDNNVSVEFIVSGGFVPLQSDALTSYSQLILNGKMLHNRYFTDLYLWSACSTYFFIQEWLLAKQDLKYLNQALIDSNVKMTVFNVVKETNGLVSINLGGRIIPKAVTGNILIYQKENDGLLSDFEVNISAVKWGENVYAS